ncbi:MAG: hypothetical protein KF732_01420 [Flavobacteriales bacterium]|nr:hypothetical protein [Flavobacteriales bacterium]MBX2958591.1 hypothetical protein [Flavobacteriales bacterium]MCL4857035.1 hypothetical protein [Flavobacteriales bacterium]
MFKSKYLWLDKEKNSFRVVVRFLGLNVGEWKPLPNLNYIALTKVKFAKTVSSPKLMGNKSCTSNFSDYKFCLFLCEDAKKKAFVFKGDYEETLQLANQVAAYLNLKVVDYTA